MKLFPALTDDEVKLICQLLSDGGSPSQMQAKMVTAFPGADADKCQAFDDFFEYAEETGLEPTPKAVKSCWQKFWLVDCVSARATFTVAVFVELPRALSLGRRLRELLDDGIFDVYLFPSTVLGKVEAGSRQRKTVEEQLGVHVECSSLETVDGPD